MKEKIVFRAVSQLIIYIISFLSTYFMVLLLEVELIGVIAFTANFIGLLSVFLDLGLSSVYLKYRREANFDEYFSGFFVLKTILLLLSYLPIAILIIFITIDYKIYFVLYFISTLVLQFSTIFTTNLQSKMKIFKSNIPVLVSTVGSSLSKLFIVLNISKTENILVLLGLNEIFFSILLIVLVFIFSKGDLKFYRIEKKKIYKILNDAKPLILSSIVLMVVPNFGNVLLDLFYGHESLAFYYFARNNVIKLILMVPASLKYIYISIYSPLFAENKNKQVEEIANQIEKFAILFSLSTMIFIFLNGKLLIEIFLPKYVPSVVFLYILSFIPLFESIRQPYSSQLIPGNKENITAIYGTLQPIIMIVLMIIIIPKEFLSLTMLGLGSIGLAYLSTISALISCCLFLYLSKRFFKVSSYKKKFLLIFIGFGAFFTSFLIKEFVLIDLVNNQILLLLISSLILYGIFALGLILFKELRRIDTRFLLSLLNLKTYKDSFIDELKKK